MTTQKMYNPSNIETRVLKCLDKYCFYFTHIDNCFYYLLDFSYLLFYQTYANHVQDGRAYFPKEISLKTSQQSQLTQLLLWVVWCYHSMLSDFQKVLLA